MTGEVSAIREYGATSGAGVLASYGYDNLGKRASIRYGNGTVTTIVPDGASRLAQLKHDLANTAQDVTTDFTYNPASQIRTWTRNNDAYAWATVPATPTSDTGSDNTAKFVVGGTVIIGGAIVRALAEPCGAMAAAAMGLGGTTVLATQ